MTRSLAATALRIGSPVIVWAAHFGAIYVATALACARAAPAAVPWAIGIATALASALALAILVREWRARGRFESWLAASLAAFALAAIVAEALAALSVRACR
jgi:hypothetical protein